MFSQACVKNSVHRWGVCIPACNGQGVCLLRGCLPWGVCLGVSTQRQTPPGPETDTPPGPEADTSPDSDWKTPPGPEAGTPTPRNDH